MKIFYFILIIFVSLMTTGCTAPSLVEVTEKYQEESQKVEAEIQKKVKEIEEKVEEKSEQEDEEELVKKVNLNVIFQSQAPDSNWELPYQEACEEAALIQATKYFSEQDLTKEIMDEEILKVVEWEKERFGLYSDTNLEEVKEMATDYFGLDVEISEDVTVENIKKQLAEGNLVLVPTAGRELGNPYYKQPGPIYHFLVIRGYTSKYLITNDVGTRRGEEYKYKFDVLINAVHDLPFKDDGTVFRPYDEDLEDEVKAEKMLQGKSRMLIVRGLTNL